jgi:quercetin dioxygenase-like cupin family protein
MRHMTTWRRFKPTSRVRTTTFFEVTGTFARGYAPIRGTSPTETAKAVAGGLSVARFKEICDELFHADADDEPWREDSRFTGKVRMKDVAPPFGVSGIDLLAVHFDTDVRTRPHVHPTEQQLYFVRGNGFVAFPRQEEQPAEEGDILIVPACELHMHGATKAGSTCHLSARLPGPSNWKPRVPADWRRFVEA